MVLHPSGLRGCDPGRLRGQQCRVPAGGIEIPTSINIESPAYQSANKSCEGLLSAVFSSQGKPPITASFKAALIAQAQCMREHGVPDYPDPTFPASGGISIQTGPGVNPQSPTFRQAEKACHTGA